MKKYGLRAIKLDFASGYIAFIVNPNAGDGNDSKVIRGFKERLRQEGCTVKNLTTQASGHARELAYFAAQDSSCSLVIAAGGDGTIREVVEGLSEKNKPLMVVPCGNENLLANELGLPSNPDKLFDIFREQKTVRLDLGVANGKKFMCIAGVGFDAEVIKRVSRKRSGHISHRDYVVPIWNTFWFHHFPTLEVSIDGEEAFSGRGFCVVGNISKYAAGIAMHCRADCSDGLLDVVIYKCRSWPRMLKHSINTIVGRHAGRGDVIYRQGRSVVISSPEKDVATEIDGDPGPQLPMHIEVIPGAVEVMTNPTAHPAGMMKRLFRSFG